MSYKVDFYACPTMQLAVMLKSGQPVHLKGLTRTFRFWWLARMYRRRMLSDLKTTRDRPGWKIADSHFAVITNDA